MSVLSTSVKLLAVASVLVDAPVFAQQVDDKPLEEVYVYGEQGATDTATKLNLSLFETPQTVTAISRVQLEEFSLTTINDVLDYTPGVTVEEVETDRSYYTARGFDIVNFQYDGVGIPFISGLNLGQQDTAMYEKVEVVKGAAGLITGLANPSATINYVRKRPTEGFQADLGLNLSDWHGRRLEGDVSGAFSDKIRGRLVAVYDTSDSYLDRHEDETSLGYGIIEFDLSDRTLLTLGHSHDNSHSTGVLWGALPLLYSDGTQTEYAVSTSNAPEWTFADTVQNQTFVELTHTLTDSWAFNAMVTRNTTDYESELFYVYGVPDRTTELGLFGYASAYQREEEQNNVDVYFSGDFTLGERAHQVVLGYNNSDTEMYEASFYDPVNGYPVLGSDWALGLSPQPNFSFFDPATSSSDIDYSQEAFYVASRLNLHDKLAVLLGARATELKQSGMSYGGAANADAKETVPYYGITYQLLDDVMVYGSYSEVFKQQTWVNANLLPLGATLGESSEVGLKKSFNNERAVLTLAYFSSDQRNFGNFVGRNEQNIAIYEGITLESRGYEIEFSGELFDGLNIGAGFTDVSVEDQFGTEIRNFIPKKLLKLSASYAVPAVDGLKVGGIVKWQDDVTTEDKLAAQDAFTLLDIAVHYQLNEKLGFSVNIENVTDEKYFQSLYWDQAYYGAPRNVSASVRWKY